MKRSRRCRSRSCGQINFSALGRGRAFAFLLSAILLTTTFPSEVQPYDLLFY
ncbi:unnamed protein product [Penicillium salamii]|nr:unnamed protein product [Penicillium salamii]